MISIPDAYPIPLYTDPHGKIRVEGTKVLLELVIHAYLRGESVEEIVESYPTLKLSDVYVVLAYYLTHQAEVNAYMLKADKSADQIQQQVESAYSPETLALHARLRAFRQRDAEVNTYFNADSKAAFRQSWHEAMTNQTHPVSTLWEDLDDDF